MGCYIVFDFSIVPPFFKKLHMSKIAISDIAWNLSEEDEIFELMNNMGITNLEISPFKSQTDLLDSEKIFKEKISNKLNKYGINIVAVQSLLYRYPELTIFDDEKTRQRTLNHLLQLIDFASRIGAKVLVFGSPKNKIKGSLSYAEATKIAVDFFKVIGDKAKSCGLMFCLEPTPVDYGADFIRNTKEAIELIKLINNDNLGINIDLGSLILNNEKVEDAILEAIPYAFHFHISEPFLESINLDSNFHKMIAGTIKQRNYNGFISIEMLKKDLNLDRIKETLSFVKKVYGKN